MVPQEWSPLGLFQLEKKRRKKQGWTQSCLQTGYAYAILPNTQSTLPLRALSIHTAVNSYLFYQLSMAPLKVWQTWLSLSPSSDTDTSLLLPSSAKMPFACRMEPTLLSLNLHSHYVSVKCYSHILTLEDRVR